MTMQSVPREFRQTHEWDEDETLGNSVDERILLPQHQPLDLARFPDFDGLNPGRKDGSQAPRDNVVGYGTVGHELVRPRALGTMAVAFAIRDGVIVEGAGALVGICLYSNTAGPSHINYPDITLYDRTPQGTPLFFNNPAWVAVPGMFRLPSVSFSALYLVVNNKATLSPDINVQGIAYVIPVE